ncbi:MAG: DUF2442 domain-containing protein [Methyloceanibacter sp.]|uniref:DUF2442 domain-containing protein n=1 Tax=Methyloceanibacter sp. TaxID=1965321 RepID=UPI003D6CCDBB
MAESFALGTSTSGAEVTHVSSQGVWLLAREKELFLPYEQFPWFKDVPLAAILKVEEPRQGHFYWPDLDVDLTEEIIEHPERFPLKSRVK